MFTQLVITALKCHKYDKNIQVTGSAALFYLTNSEYRSEQSVKLRRQVIQVVLNGMESYQEVTVQRNCCLTLCNFSIPEELEFQYRRVNELLLGILSPTRQDESIQRIAVHLCNALVCQVDNDHKEAVGKMGFVVTMLKLIQKKLLDKTCDQVMEFSWSALWNITDETPDNCEMFLNFNGMKLFLDCLKVGSARTGCHTPSMPSRTSFPWPHRPATHPMSAAGRSVGKLFSASLPESPSAREPQPVLPAQRLSPANKIQFCPEYRTLLVSVAS